jgi:hypothetical protein
MKKVDSTLRSYLIILSATILLNSSNAAHAVESILVIPSGSGVSYRSKDNRLNPQRPCPTPLSKRTSLQRGDRLCTDSNSSAVVQCSTRSSPAILGKRQTEAVSINKLCPEPMRKQLVDPESFLEGGIDEKTPYIIAPRYTRLLNQCSVFRWHRVPGAISYTVTLEKIQAGRKDLWVAPRLILQKSTQIISYPYPCEQKLNSDADYQLIVEAIFANGNRISSKEKINISEYKSDVRGVSGLKFRFYPKAIANQIENDISIIKDSSLKHYKNEDEKIRDFLIPFYQEKNLYAEAIAELEKLIKNGSKEPATYRTLASLYAQSGLAQLAKTNYEQAIYQASLRGDRQEQEKANAELKELCKKLGEKLPGCAN